MPSIVGPNVSKKYVTWRALIYSLQPCCFTH